MNETERKQIKGALLKCAEENENRPIFTGYVVVSSVCKSAVERIEELEKENIELKSKNKWYSEQVCNKECAEVWGKITEATEIIKFLINPQLLDKPQYYEWRLKAEKFIKGIEK